jgi:UDP-glucose 4-epimerase
MTIAVVTGAAGFIGSHLVDLLLAEGHDVRALDVDANPQRIARHIGKNRFTYRTANVCSLSGTFSIWEGADWVFHLAGLADIVPSVELPLNYMLINVMGTASVLEAARKAGVKKFLYAASASCYGDHPITPTLESNVCRPCYPYALSKYLGEQACMHWLKVYGLPVNSLRLFNVYGPGSRTSGAYGAVMGTWLKQKLEGAPLTVIGDGSQSRDFVHVRDVAQAFLLAAQTDKVGGIWNVGYGVPQTINRLAALIGGPNYPRVQLPVRAGEPRVTWAAIGRIQDELNWIPEVDFETGIGEMVERIEEWRDTPLWTEEGIAAATEAWHRNLKVS